MGRSYAGAFQGGRDDEDQWMIETSSQKGWRLSWLQLRSGEGWWWWSHGKKYTASFIENSLRNRQYVKHFIYMISFSLYSNTHNTGITHPILQKQNWVKIFEELVHVHTESKESLSGWKVCALHMMSLYRGQKCDIKKILERKWPAY